MSQERIALVEQDYIRRNILEEIGDRPKLHNADLIYQIVSFALERGFHAILEGILNFSTYGDMLAKLHKENPDTHVYYFDVSLEETLRRHQTKPNRHEFGDDKLREWYKDKDFSHLPNEKILPETLSVEDTLTLILEESGLQKF